MLRSRTVAALFASVLIVASTRALQAQRIQVSGRGDLETDTILARIRTSGQYRLIVADTVLPPGDTIRGNVLFSATTIKLENVILGDVAIVDANVFMRPGSHITGDVVNISGALFRGPGSMIDGSITEYRDLNYYAERTADGVRITGVRASSLFDADGLWGLHVPEYDRVSGLTVRVGASYLLPRAGTTEPGIHGWIGYQTSRERLLGGADAAIRAGNFRFAAGAERNVYTNDAWVRNRTNSLSFLVRGRDYRDYYAADRFTAGPSVEFRGPDSRLYTIGLRAMIENAHSLPSLNPFHMSGVEVARPNPSIDDGRIVSLTLGSSARWNNDVLVGHIDANVEAANDVIGGEHSFNRIDFGGDVALRAFARHTLRVKWQMQAPLPGTDSLPRQRWTTMGGRATLFTRAQGELRGDRLVYVSTEYSIPLPRFTTIPLVGRPSVEAVHRIGRAWTLGQDSTLIQNIGIRIRTRFAYVMYITDPSDADAGKFVGGFSIARRFPWTPQ